MVKLVKKSLVVALAVTCGWNSPDADAKKKGDTPVGQGTHYEVEMKTSEGTVRLKLYNDTPIHRDNFVKLVKEGFYNHLMFHRVIDGFMIQAGDPDSREASQVKTYGKNDAGYKLDAEILSHYYHKKGVLAAARQGDATNPERKSSGSQFYIVVGKVQTDSLLQVAWKRIGNRPGAEITPDREQVYRTEGGSPHLDGAYTIFGEVVSGMKVVERISKTPTGSNDRPKKDVFIKEVTVEVVEDKPEKKR